MFLRDSEAMGGCTAHASAESCAPRWPPQVPYLGLIQQTLWACPDSPMILLEAPHVGLTLQLRSRSVDDVAHAAAQILWRHTYEGACFVAHSYGTFCVSRICQLHRSLVHSVVSHGHKSLVCSNKGHRCVASRPPHLTGLFFKVRCLLKSEAFVTVPILF